MAIAIVVLAVKALTASLGVLAVQTGPRISLAVSVVTICSMVAVVIFSIEAEGARLVLLDAAVGLALAARGDTLGAAPATAVRVQIVLVLHLRGTPPTVAFAFLTAARVRADVRRVRSVELRERVKGCAGFDLVHVAPRGVRASPVEFLEFLQDAALLAEDSPATAREVR